MRLKRIFLLFLFLVFIFPLCWAADNLEVLRREMVEQQIKQRGVKNERVLRAMGQVKRHEFVPKHLVLHAYQDSPLRIGKGQTISQPYIVGLMTELINPQAQERVLEIGTGSGYQAAVLALLCREVYTIEIISQLAESAARRLRRLGYKNVFVKTGDGFLGWPEKAPFDCIIITCSADKIPEPLKIQLKEGGRLVMPLAEGYPQKLCLFRKKNGKLIRKDIIPVLFVPMTGRIQE